MKNQDRDLKKKIINESFEEARHMKM